MPMPTAPLPGVKPDEADLVANGSPDVVMAAAVADAASLVAGPSGLGFATILAQATQESGLKARTHNKSSSAAGPFQFLDRTWLDLVRRFGAAYGLGDLASSIVVHHGVPTVADPAIRKRILDLREDAQIAGGMAARHLSEGRTHLSKRLGRPASEIESRIAYVMGVAGAARLIRSAEKTPDAVGAALLPEAAHANKSLFYTKDGSALTAHQIVARLTHEMHADQVKLASLVPAEPKRTLFDGGGPTMASPLLAQELG
ncbi:MAG: hypothetical protein P4M00_19860 [Azospirillaceae bacterium]|nr:hypothetical protein [Azospirillaceae bacterium]